MTLLITAFAAVISSVVWYVTDNNMRIGTLALIYWGASLMWLIDAVVEYMELGAQYFSPAPLDMLNDAFLGLSAVLLGMIIWFVTVLVNDPMGKFGKKKN